MAVGRLKKTGAMTALAATLALLAAPASAQDGRGGWRGRGGDAGAQAQGGGGRGQGGGSGAWQGNARGGGERGWRGQGAATAVPAPAAPQAQVQPQQQAPQQRTWWRGQGGDGGTRDGWRARGGDGAARDGGWRGRAERVQPPVANAPAPQVQPQQSWQDRSWSQRGDRANGQWQGRNRSYVDPDRNRTYRDTRRDDGSRWQGERQGYRGSYGNWNRDWRRDNRYDWQGYRAQNRGVYRLGTYYAPYRNYSYRRLSTGFYLDTVFFGSRYWINDPWYYRLPPADGPFRWVRYYDDALLVDTYSGEVVDVIYDFFW